MNAKLKSTMAHYFGLSATLCFLVLWLMTGVVLAQDTTGKLEVEVFRCGFRPVSAITFPAPRS